MIIVTDAKVLEGYRVFLRFSDGTEGEANLATMMPFDGIFLPFRKREDFERGFYDPELKTIAWPWGADLCPDYLYALVHDLDLKPFRKNLDTKAFPDILSFRSLEDVEYAFRSAATALTQIDNSPEGWKWIVLNIHDALHELMLQALAGHSAIKESRQRMENWANGGNDWPPYFQRSLEAFTSLYARLKSGDMLQYATSRMYTPEHKEEELVNELAKVRGALLKLMPHSQVFSQSKLFEMVSGTLPLMEFLLLDSGNILWPRGPVKDKVLEAFQTLKSEVCLRFQEYSHELPTPSG